MTLSAVGSASTALSLLNPASSSSSNSASGASSSGDTTTVTTAADGTVTTTVTAPNGTVISVTVTKPSKTESQASNPNALLDVKVSRFLADRTELGRSDPQPRAGWGHAVAGAGAGGFGPG